MNTKKLKESACLRSLIVFDTMRLTSRMLQSESLTDGRLESFQKRVGSFGHLCRWQSAED
jgi:hypothetical protein